MEGHYSDPIHQGDQKEDTSRNNIPQNFFAESGQALLGNLDSFRHFDFAPTEKLPFKSLKLLGRGIQGHVDEVEYIPQGCTFVRKKWFIRATSQKKEKARDQLFSEVAILKKLRDGCHVIRLLATYCQDTELGLELGLLHLPLGQCDLTVLLDKPAHERSGLISDDDLERGFGCLSAALQYLHQQCIRHKDIKPGNILVDGPSLVITDFGISRDFSELSSSLTDDYAIGTFSYYAPEVAADRPRGCSADVFSLGCVLLEIWSVLFGLAPKDQHSFPSLKPYFKNLEKVQSWIKKKKSSEDSPLRVFWLQACQLMVARAPSKRPRMSSVLLRLREEYERQPSVFSTMCCRGCLETHVVQSTEENLDELRNADFIWDLDVETLSDQDHPTEILPNSNQGYTHDIFKLLASPILPRDILQRWYLTVYLDNGRPLRSYGTLPVSVNYTFDFGESLIDRVVFKAGTFGKTVELYRRSNWEKGPCFRNAPCDQRFDEPMRIRSYKIMWD
ncbi:MAG: hypothetical protein M1840_007417 [Geoglossum simile]|nr:MAG: hypothetical protein M1840_007417 [Geoglossum simile]